MTEIFGKMEGDSGLPQVTKDDVRRTLRTYREFLSGFRERREQAYEETLAKISSGFLQGCRLREVNVRQMSSQDPVYSFFCRAEEALDDLVTRKFAKISAKERQQLRILDLTLYGPAKIDQIIHLIARTMSSDRPNLTIGGEKIPADRIRQRLMKIRSGHVSYVLDSLRKVTRPIRNMRGYLLTSLCNAVETLPFTKWQQGMILEGQEESSAAWDDDDDSSGKGSAPRAYDYDEAMALSNGWRTAV